MVVGIQRVLHKELDYLTESALTDRVDNHLEKAMRNYEELHQVEKDHGEMMNEFIKSAKEARALLDQGTTIPQRPELLPLARSRGRSPAFKDTGWCYRTKPP